MPEIKQDNRVSAQHLSSPHVFFPDGQFRPARIVMENGLITEVQDIAEHELVSTNHFLVPGFIDLQVNGIDEVDVWSAALTNDAGLWSRLDGLLLDQGVTAWCPTLVTSKKSSYAQALKTIQSMQQRADLVPYIIGAHVEGPFLGRAPGAHNVEDIIAPDSAWLAQIIGDISLMTLGAEVEHASQIIAMLSQSKVVCSIGHSRPTRQEFDSAVSHGANLVTHLFNAMSGLHHRQPGLAAWALMEPKMAVTIIADGIHVAPEMIALAFTVKPKGMVLVTDSVAHLTHDAQPYRMSQGAPRLPDGTLAGSTLRMPKALQICVQEAGVSLEYALGAATLTPANVMGLANRGRIAVGCIADIVCLSNAFTVESVWRSGVQVR